MKLFLSAIGLCSHDASCHWISPSRSDTSCSLVRQIVQAFIWFDAGYWKEVVIIQLRMIAISKLSDPIKFTKTSRVIDALILLIWGRFLVEIMRVWQLINYFSSPQRIGWLICCNAKTVRSNDLLSALLVGWYGEVVICILFLLGSIDCRRRSRHRYVRFSFHSPSE
jgi:hypothetical protein